MTESTEDTTQAKPETVEVEDLDTFVRILSGWHARKVAQLEHYLKVPDGQVIQIGDDPELTLTGAVLRAFQAGINTALMEVGVLPFAFEVEGATNDGQQALPLSPEAASDGSTGP
jgi:hypothetical protein